MHLLKSFSAGIILAVGFCHVLPDANKTLGELVEYPLAFFVAMMGSIAVLGLSQVVDGLVADMAKRKKALGPSSQAALECLDVLKTSQTRVAMDAPESSLEQQQPEDPQQGKSADLDSRRGTVVVFTVGDDSVDDAFRKKSCKLPPTHAHSLSHSNADQGGGHNDAAHVVSAFKQHSLAIAYLMEVIARWQ